MPKVPETLAPRRKSRQIKVGKVLVGGDAPVSVQSMTTTPTTNINATLQQIAELTASGCDIVRVAVPTRDDAETLPMRRGLGLVVIDPPGASVGMVLLYSSMLPVAAKRVWKENASSSICGVLPASGRAFALSR